MPGGGVGSPENRAYAEAAKQREAAAAAEAAAATAKAQQTAKDNLALNTKAAAFLQLLNKDKTSADYTTDGKVDAVKVAQGMTDYMKQTGVKPGTKPEDVLASMASEIKADPDVTKRMTAISKLNDGKPDAYNVGVLQYGLQTKGLSYLAVNGEMNLQTTKGLEGLQTAEAKSARVTAQIVAAAKDGNAPVEHAKPQVDLKKEESEAYLKVLGKTYDQFKAEASLAGKDLANKGATSPEALAALKAAVTGTPEAGKYIRNMIDRQNAQPGSVNGADTIALQYVLKANGKDIGDFRNANGQRTGIDGVMGDKTFSASVAALSMQGMIPPTTRPTAPSTEPVATAAPQSGELSSGGLRVNGKTAEQLRAEAAARNNQPAPAAVAAAPVPAGGLTPEQARYNDLEQAEAARAERAAIARGQTPGSGVPAGYVRTNAPQNTTIQPPPLATPGYFPQPQATVFAPPAPAVYNPIAVYTARVPQITVIPTYQAGPWQRNLVVQQNPCEEARIYQNSTRIGAPVIVNTGYSQIYNARAGQMAPQGWYASDPTAQAAINLAQGVNELTDGRHRNNFDGTGRTMAGLLGLAPQLLRGLGAPGGR